MPLTLTSRKDKQRSSETYEFFMCRLLGLSAETSVEEILSLLLALPFPQTQWVLNPVSSEWQPEIPAGRFYALEHNGKLNTFFVQKASFAQQMVFLNVLGLTMQIERHDDFRQAVIFFKFQQYLLKLGIANPPIPDSAAMPLNIKRILLVHPQYLEDPEIAAGLHVSPRKNAADNHVFFVCNMASLRMALAYCDKNTTLIIDGHWVHDHAISYGIWTQKNAIEISEDIKALIDEFPGKIGSIRLLGCHSGKLRTRDQLASDYDEAHFIFKDRVIDDFKQLDMSLFRNRAVYLSQAGESPYVENSLASRMYEKIKDLPIRLTASPALTYPYPSGVAASQYNIGSDSEQWCMPPAWAIVQTADLPWYMKVNCLKSVTIIKVSEASDHISPDTHWLKKM